MKCWGYIEGDVDFKEIFEQVYLVMDVQVVMKEMGQILLDIIYKFYMIMGKIFDLVELDVYIESFVIKWI